MEIFFPLQIYSKLYNMQYQYKRSRLFQTSNRFKGTIEYPSFSMAHLMFGETLCMTLTHYQVDKSSL